MGQIEDREPHRQVLFGPLGEFGRFFSPDFDRLLQQTLGLGLVGGVEDGPDTLSDGFTLVNPGDIGLGIQLQMELAALPGDAGKDGSAGRLQAGMVVGDDQLDSVQAAPNQAFHEGAPVNFGLRQGDRNAEHPALAVSGDANGNQHGTIDQASAFAHPFIAGVEENIRRFTKGTLPPGGKSNIKSLSSAADLGGRNRYIRTNQSLKDSDDFPRGHALNIHFRKSNIEWLMLNHPHDCPVCDEGGECHLQDMTEMTGHTFRVYRGRKRTHRNQYLGPFINHEMNRCIACYRCVRFYQDYCGGDDLQVFAAHNHVYFGRHEDGVLENEFSGNLVEVCPTGVFTDKTFSQHYTRKWDLQSAPSVCVHCALGCNTSPGERCGTLRRIVNRYHGEINGYFLCDRGRFGYDFVNSDRRIRQPLLRNQPPMGGKGAGTYFSKLLEKSTGTIGVGSPRASLEANFALRELVGADNFHLGFSDGEYAQIKGILEILQQGPVRIASLRDAEQADAVLILGEDVSNTAPRLALSLRQAVRNQAYAIADRLKIPRWQDAAVREAAQHEKSPLFVASSAPTRLDDIAALTCRGSPEDLARLGFAVAHKLNSKAPGLPGVRAELDDHAALIAQTLVSAKRPLIVSGTSCHSEAVIQAAAQTAWALASLRGGKPTDIHLVVPECNSLGLALMGVRPLGDAFAAIDRGQADTLVVLENDLYRRAEKQRVDAFLDRARQVIVIDHILHETAKKAHLVLPAATFAETEGTLVSSEGRAQRFFSVFPPTGDCQDSWRWLRDAGKKPWRNLDELIAECANTLPVFAPIPQAAPGSGFRIAGQRIPRQPHRYSGRTAMLANVRIHEPKQPVDPDSALAFSMEGAESDRPAPLNPFVWAPGWNSNQSVNKFQDEVGASLRGGDPGLRLIEAKPGETPQWFGPPSLPARNGLRLVPLPQIFGSEELSMLSPPMAELAPKSCLALHPDDAAKRGLKPGDQVSIKLSGENCFLPVMILPGLARGVAGIPSGLPELPWFDSTAAFWDYQTSSADES